ncbi:unnamed protein product [Leptidea sinapis]|uniref:15-hydroxyprostaglandin dehydrogenase [NAD(+)] n=1 Tax=Leptidea sinapis TaxID=189913 RepID=A0A5E4QI63_9NEOP|nr:unnamed protein product [Leptidea sinapis]
MTSQWKTQDKVFLITGGASGLGAEYAKIFLQLGAKAMFIKCDVSKEDEIKTAFQQVLDANKRIDVIINNAGVGNDSLHQWRTASEVNWQGVVSFTLKGMEHMRKDKEGAGGTIINVSSIAALCKCAPFPIYGGAKLAVGYSSMEHMRKDKGGTGGTIINISSIAALCKYPIYPTYCGSKIAVLHFGQTLSVSMEHMRKDKGGTGGTIINISSISALCKYPAFPTYCGSKIAVLHFGQTLSNVAVLDIAEAVGKTFVASLNEKYPVKAMFIKCDVSKEDEIKTAFQQVLDANKRKDVIINNAGIFNDSPHLWRTASDVNWQGVVSFTLKGMEHMRKDKGGTGGTIINISSAAALLKCPSFPMYCGAKLAVLHFGQTLSVSKLIKSKRMTSKKNVAVLDIAEAVGKTYVASLNETYPGKAMFIKCDVSKEDEIKSAFQQVLDANKRIDVIINNAGMLNDSPHLWRTACDVNWQGSVSFTLKGMEHMRKDKGGAGGTIINISSAAALLKSPSFPMYCAAKLAVLHFSQTLSKLRHIVRPAHF